MASKAKKKAATAEPQLKFEDLTVGECLALVDGICDEKAKYVRYGKDFRKAWDVMQKVHNHRITLYDAIDYSDDEPPFPQEMLADIRKYFKANAIDDRTMGYNLRNFDRSKLLVAPKTADEKFASFMSALKAYVEERLK